jgi:hypothetical protein
MARLPVGDFVLLVIHSECLFFPPPAILHLYFARFFNHFLCDYGELKHREPFINLLTQGMVMGQSFSVKSSGKYLRKELVDFTGMHIF